jgi:hypothetical protein
VVSGALPSGISLNSAGVLSGTPDTVNTAGTPVTIQVQDSGSPAQLITISGNIHVSPVLSITTQTGPLPDAIVGQVYNFTLLSSGGLAPITWTVSSGNLPMGLTLASDGTIGGTPTVANTAGTPFTIQLQDSSNPTKQTALQTFSIRIGTRLTISTPSGALPGGIQGLTYNVSLQGGGGIGTLTWTATGGQLPPGLMLNAAGFISGTPTTAGNYSFTAGLQDSSSPTRQAASVTLSISIASPMAITTPAGALPNALYKVAYSQPLTVSGGTVPIAWSIASGHLPTGMSLSTSGVISGSPTALGTFSFTVKATDSGAPQQTASASFTIAVASSIKVSFAVQPSNTAVGAAISPAVKVLVVDNLGGAVPGATVKMTFAMGPGSATLGGQTVQTTGTDGVAIFPNLSINKPGRSYELRATVTSPHGGGDPDEESAQFNVR